MTNALAWPTLAVTALLTLAAWPAAAQGDAARGRTLYQSRCTACHSLDYHGVGPAHRGVFGRAAGQAQGFDYSPALKNARLVWTDETLDRWLADPEATVPGQRMGFSVPDVQERADLIAYLRQAAATK